MKQVHGIDYQSRVGCVLSDGEPELLDWLDREPVKSVFPTIEIGCCPITICSLDRGGAVPRDLPQKVSND